MLSLGPDPGFSDPLWSGYAAQALPVVPDRNGSFCSEFPWRRRPVTASTARNSLELLIGVYSTEEIAKWVLKSLERLQQERAIALASTAVLSKTLNGRFLTRQIVDWNLSEGGIIDGLTASLVALFNPLGELGTVPFHVGGLAVEILVENLAEIGVTYEELRILARQIQPETTLVMVLTPETWLSRLMIEMAHGEVQIMNKSILLGLRASLGDHFIDLAQAVIREQAESP